MQSSSPRIWTHSVYEAGYHQMLPDFKPSGIRLDPSFHGNYGTQFQKSYLWNNTSESWRSPLWSDQFLSKPDELSSKMAGNMSQQTTPKAHMPDFRNVTIKPEIFEEDYPRWVKQEFPMNLNQGGTEKMSRSKADLRKKNSVPSAGNSGSCMAGANVMKICKMIAQAESNLTSTYHTMTSLDLSQCPTGSNPSLGTMEMVSEMSTFTETPPPSPPYTPQHSTTSSSSRSSTCSIPTFLEDVPENGKTYAILQSPRQKTLPSFASDTDTSPDTELNRWEKVHPIDWTSEEVMDFIYWLALYTTNEGSIPDIKAHRLRNSSGLDLMRMSPGDFQEISQEYGQLFYNKFQALLQQAEFAHPPHLMSLEDDWYTAGEDPYLNSIVLKLEPSLNIQGHEYGFDPQDQFCGFPVCPTEHHTDPGYMSADSTGSSGCSYSEETTHQIPMVTPNDYQPPMMAQRPLQQMTHQQPLVKKRGPGRPRKIQPDGQPRPPCQRGRKPGQTTKGNHLYEFILLLLKDRASNPSLVKWEDPENGVFRFVQSERVAKLWGKKKNNNKMTYEKLSRAMRFCRSVGYFAPLPRDRGFPKKLCFKFGEKAQNWYTGETYYS